MLHVVQLREEAAGIRRAVPGELVTGLLAEVGTVDQEEHALRAGVLDEAIDFGAGGERLSRARGHVNERPRPALRERVFESANRLDLAIAHTRGDERRCLRHPVEARSQRVAFGRPLAERFGTMECEDAARARIGIALVGKKRLDARGLAAEGWPAGETCPELLRQLTSLGSRP